MLLRVSVNFIKYIGVRPKRAETGIGAEQDLPPTILRTWKIYWVRIQKYPPTESDKLALSEFLLH